MELAHLVVDVCVFYAMSENDPSYDKQLCDYFQKCASLQALQLEPFHDDGICEVCINSAVRWSILPGTDMLQNGWQSS